VSGSELAGVKVADFSAVVAGPYCTRLMARSGADVIKIEPPEGDHLRSLRPLRDGNSAFFGALNAGKRSVALDLRTTDWADVVVENFRPGVMARFGLDYPALALERPELVYCSVTGYGQVGPWTSRPAIAAIVHATSGYDLALASYQPGMTRPPVAGIHTADVLSASLALSGVLAALRAAEQTGTGRHVDVAMLDSMLSLLTGEVMSAQFPGEHNVRGYPPARTSDGFVMIGAVSQRLFEALMTTIGRPELINDPRFKVNADRWANAAELDAVIEEWTAVRTGDDCEATLLAAGVPASKYRTVSEQFGLEQTAARKTFATVADDSGEYQIVDSPFHFRLPGPAAAPEPRPQPPRVPALGADTRTVLEQFLGHEETARLITAGIAVDGSTLQEGAR
jgi:crotonobetainyl-CoA:carnitine CoA-transferase CaiB-like acyl-CoA transferase